MANSQDQNIIDLTLESDGDGLSSMSRDNLRKRCQELQDGVMARDLLIDEQKRITAHLLGRIERTLDADDNYETIPKLRADLDAANQQIQYQANRLSQKEEDAESAQKGEKALERMYNSLADKHDAVKVEWGDDYKDEEIDELRSTNQLLNRLINSLQIGMGGDQEGGSATNGQQFEVTIRPGKENAIKVELD